MAISISERNVAEAVGFEPTRRSSRLTVFKTAPFNHSGMLPLFQAYA